MINQIKKFALKNRFCERVTYIAYRICTLFYSLLFLACRVFPIKENKIVACNMKGKRYGDNPKYIFDEIIRQNLDYELVWLMKGERDPEIPEGIKCAPYNPFSMAYHLSTAKVWIDSNMKSLGTLKRKKQIYIQTWHGSPSLKKLGLDEKGNTNIFCSKQAYISNAKIEDLMLSNCKPAIDMFRSAFAYKGEILKCGCPRNDIFFEDSKKYREKVFKHYSLKNEHIILFAPTYRGDLNTDCMEMNFSHVISSCEERFGGEWLVFVRLHPNNIHDAERFIQYSEKIINVTEYNVMQELLVASDVLITDYSSSMFDFSITRKPCFLYATDIEKYKNERDFYFDIMELPFSVSQDENELNKNINNFDEKEYAEKLRIFFNQIEMCEKGTASKQVVQYMKNLI